MSVPPQPDLKDTTTKHLHPTEPVATHLLAPLGVSLTEVLRVLLQLVYLLGEGLHLPDNVQVGVEESVYTRHVFSVLLAR